LFKTTNKFSSGQNFGVKVVVLKESILMRIFYSIVLIFFSLAFSANAQSREEFDSQQGPFDNEYIHIFPNPAVDFVHVRLDKVPVREVIFTVHNIIGNEITVETEVISEHEIRVRVKDLDSGYYLLALKDDKDHFRGTYKFLKR
jgi:hypothetical protein